MGDDELSAYIDQISAMTGVTGKKPSLAGPLDFQFGLNPGTFSLGLNGLGTLSNLWGGLQANKLAKEQFRFTKDITNTNLNNQIKSYNTSLEDRIRSRAAVEGQSAQQAEAYLAKNRLTR